MTGFPANVYASGDSQTIVRTVEIIGKFWPKGHLWSFDEMLFVDSENVVYKSSPHGAGLIEVDDPPAITLPYATEDEEE